MEEDKHVYIVINAHPKMIFDREKFHYMEKPLEGAFEDWDSAWKYIIDNDKDGVWHVVIEPVQDRIVNKKDSRSWFMGTCKNCGYNVVVNYPEDRYRHQWNCSNDLCKFHCYEDTMGKEVPSWVTVEQI